ncbi:Protein NETWORKED 1D [Glycine soja]
MSLLPSTIISKGQKEQLDFKNLHHDLVVAEGTGKRLLLRIFQGLSSYNIERESVVVLLPEPWRLSLKQIPGECIHVIRHAHKTMAEAFPNQVPMMLTDDLPVVSPTETEPHTPEMRHPSRAFLDPGEPQKDASAHFHAIKRNGGYTSEPDSPLNKTGLKQLNDLYIPGEQENLPKFARRGLNFFETQEESNEQNSGSNNTLSESERVTKAETEILALKKAIAKLEDEKEAGLLQYQQSLEKMSNLELEVSTAQENSQKLDERASKAEAKVQALKEAQIKLQAESEASLLQYQECLEKISNLEKNISSLQKEARELNDRATKAETETESLKQELARVKAEKEATLVQYNQFLETISKLEERIKEEHVDIAEKEIEALELQVTKLNEEKEDVALHYQQCIEIISSLEYKLSCAEEKVHRLNSKIVDGKCLLLETSNHTLQSELQSLAQKVGSQSEQLNEKQQELGRLWGCIQEERLRFIEAKTAFQTLQQLHSQSQEELRSLASEHNSKVEILRNVESRKQALEDEVHRDEILNLRETIEKVEQEQEIYCLKEELNDVNKKHEAVIEECRQRIKLNGIKRPRVSCCERNLNTKEGLSLNLQDSGTLKRVAWGLDVGTREVRSTDLDPQCFGSSVKKLQDENLKLKETCEADKGEKKALLVKLETMEKLLEKNIVLQNSLSDLNAELDSVRGKVNVLEETCQSLLVEKSNLAAEKATLFSQLQSTTEKLEKLSEKRNLLENSLFDVNTELEGLRVKSKVLEDTCRSLDHEKSSICQEKETLVSLLNITHQTLKDLEKLHSELELKHLELKGEKESALQKVEELLVSLYSEREENSRVLKLNEDELAEKELQILILQEDANCKKKEYEEELDRAIHAQLEIFILQKCIDDLEKKNLSFLVDVNSLSKKIKILRIGLIQVLKTPDNNSGHFGEDMLVEDQMLLNHIYGKLQERQKSFDTIFNGSQQMAIENSILITFLEQLKLKVENLVTQRNTLDEEFNIQSKQFLALQIEVQKILRKNQELELTISKVEDRMEVMTIETDNLQKQLSDLEKSHNNLQEDSCKILEEKKSLTRRFLDLGEEKSNLEEEICVMIHEAIAQSNLSLIYEDIIFEKLMELKELGEDLDKHCSANNDLDERLRVMMCKLENAEMENSHLKESFVKSNVELHLVESINGHLSCQIRDEREMLHLKENELLEAAEMFHVLHTEKTELQRMVEDLKIKYDEARVMLEEQANQILKLSSDKDHQNEELICLSEVNQKLESEMGYLRQELGETKLREKKLGDEIRQIKAHISELHLHAEAQAVEYKQKSTSSSSMEEGYNVEELRFNVECQRKDQEEGGRNMR